MLAKNKITDPDFSVKKRLAEIAAAIKAGTPAKNFEKELDSLLNTKLPQRDEAQEEAWENEYRRSETD